jgi:YHS domain-containing protein
MAEVRDPVCGKMLNPETAEYKAIHENKVYYFCSAKHQSEFNENHGVYLQQSSSDRHAAHYAGYCDTSGCNRPARGIAWYMYMALLFFVLLLLLLVR